MKRTRNILLTLYLTSLAITLLMMVSFECNIITEGPAQGYDTAEFLLSCFMILVTLTNIVLGLRLFKFPSVEHMLKGSPRHLLIFGSIRISMILMPVMANTLLYYLFVRPSFGYLAIIGALASVFIFPSMSRCKNETGGFEFGSTKQ